MFQTLQRNWWRTLLALLVISIGTIAALATHHRLTTKAASSAGFTMTMGADVYTLIEQAPPSYDSSTNTMHFGSMSVSNNGIDQGTFGGDLSWITDGQSVTTLGGRNVLNETATTSLTGTGSFSTLATQLSGTAATNLSVPPLSSNTSYNSLIDANATVTSEIRDGLGHVETILTCPENPRNPQRECGAFGSTPAGVAHFGFPDSGPAIAMAHGIKRVQEGFDHIQTAVDTLSSAANVNEGSSIASLATHTGGGPRLATQPQIAPFLAALIPIVTGLVLAVGGTTLSYYCGIKDHVAQDGSKKGCLGLPKMFWLVVGGLMMLLSGFVYAAIGKALASVPLISTQTYSAAETVIGGSEMAEMAETFGLDAFPNASVVISEEDILSAPFSATFEMSPR
jgi:hypothetical protein